MNCTNIRFGKDTTLIIKGFAIVFMIVLHVFGGGGWYDADLAMNHNEALMKFMGAFKICVGMYVFMVGYGYAFSKTKDFAYSFKHIKQLLSVFWLILFVFAIPAAANFIDDSKDLIHNMFGLSSSLCWVSWFVYFYIWAMCIMPFASRLIDRKPIIYTPILMLLAFGAMAAVHRIMSLNDWTQALFDCLLNTPLLLLGYTFARLNIYEKIRIPASWVTVIISIIVAALVIVSRAYIQGYATFITRLIETPVIILCILAMFNAKPLKFTRKVFSELGDKSVYMWFFHALFFTAATRQVYQQFIMVSDNLWIIALWTIILSYACSYILKMVKEF